MGAQIVVSTSWPEASDTSLGKPLRQTQHELTGKRALDGQGLDICMQVHEQVERFLVGARCRLRPSDRQNTTVLLDPDFGTGLEARYNRIREAM
jgi:hypothetical protein